MLTPGGPTADRENLTMECRRTIALPVYVPALAGILLAPQHHPSLHVEGLQAKAAGL